MLLAHSMKCESRLKSRFKDQSLDKLMHKNGNRSQCQLHPLGGQVVSGEGPLQMPSQCCLRLSPHFPGLGGQQGCLSVLSRFAFKSLQECILSTCTFLPSLPTPHPFQNGEVKSLREMRNLGSIPSGQCSKEAINTLLLS